MKSEFKNCNGSVPALVTAGTPKKENSKSIPSPSSPRQLAVRMKSKSSVGGNGCVTISKSHRKGRSPTSRSIRATINVDNYDKTLHSQKLALLRQSFEKACRDWRSSQVEVEEIEAEATAIYERYQSELALLQHERNAARLIRQDKLNKLVEIQEEVNKWQDFQAVI